MNPSNTHDSPTSVDAGLPAMSDPNNISNESTSVDIERRTERSVLGNTAQSTADRRTIR